MYKTNSLRVEDLRLCSIMLFQWLQSVLYHSGHGITSWQHHSEQLKSFKMEMILNEVFQIILTILIGAN